MDNTVTCTACDGEGTVTEYDTAGDGFLDKECPECGGEGWIDEEERDDD